MTTTCPGPAGSVDLFPPVRRDASVIRIAVVIAVILHLAALVAPIVIEAEPPPPPKPEVRLPTVTVYDIPAPTERIEPPERLQRDRSEPIPVPRDYRLDEVEEADLRVEVDESSWDVSDDGPSLLGEPDLPDLPDRVTVGAPGLVPPVLVRKIVPEFPDLARRARRSGTVILSAVVDQTGKVIEIEVVSAPNPDLGFTEQAIEAVDRWVYQPGRLGGRPIAVSLVIEVTFTLN